LSDISLGALVSTWIHQAWLQPHSTHLAYIGPGAGFAFLGSFLTLLAGFLMSVVSFLLWPFRTAWRVIRRRRGFQAIMPGSSFSLIPPYTVGDFAVVPGDSIEAEVSYDETSQLFTVHLNDLTSGQSFKISSAVPNAQRTSAEWIAEAPSNAKKTLPLSRFSSVFFGHYYTGVSATNHATVNGATGSIGTFGKISEIVMAKGDGSIKALPWPLSSNKSNAICCL
jgi:hypothetical protein